MIRLVIIYALATIFIAGGIFAFLVNNYCQREGCQAERLQFSEARRKDRVAME